MGQSACQSGHMVKKLRVKVVKTACQSGPPEPLYRFLIDLNTNRDAGRVPRVGSGNVRQYRWRKPCRSSVATAVLSSGEPEAQSATPRRRAAFEAAFCAATGAVGACGAPLKKLGASGPLLTVMVHRLLWRLNLMSPKDSTSSGHCCERHFIARSRRLAKLLSREAYPQRLRRYPSVRS